MGDDRDMAIEIRPMCEADLGALAEVNDAAFTELRERFHLPRRPSTPEDLARDVLRLRRFLETDPGGSWVAEEDGELVGLTQALLRDGLWHLSLLSVAPGAQARGAGRALLDAALAYGPPDGPAMLLCSRDPRAARRYRAAGFDLHPAVTAWGHVDPAGLPPDDGRVRAGTAADLALVEEIDLAVRGASRAVEVGWLLEHLDGVLVVAGDRGWGLRLHNRPYALAALDEATAAAILVALLRGVDAGGDETEVGWLTAHHQWAVDVALAARLELHPVGPFFVRNLPGPFPLALASGAFG